MAATHVSDASRERTGLVFAALCALNGAFVPSVAKLTTNYGSPLFVATATTVFAALFACMVAVVRGEWRPLFAARIGWRLALIGVLGTAIAFTTLYAGTKRSTAVETILCLQIEPLYSLFAAWAFLGQQPSRRRLAATGVILAGIVLAVGTRGFSGSSGVWFLLVTPLFWQSTHLIVLRGLGGIPPPVITAARYIHGSLALLAFTLVSGDWNMPPRPVLSTAIPLLALQGVVLSYMGTLVWYQAVTRLDLARTTAIVVPSIPVLSFAASFAILGEVPSANQWCGMALVAAGVLTFVTGPAAVSRPATIRAAEAEALR